MPNHLTIPTDIGALFHMGLIAYYIINHPYIVVIIDS